MRQQLESARHDHGFLRRILLEMRGTDSGTHPYSITIGPEARGL